MSRPLVALLFAACGGLLLHEGWRAAHSLAGHMDYYSKGVAYKIDGHIRLPAFILCFAGGVLLILAAWGLLARAGRSTGRRGRRGR
jgi:hypothetical protein